MSSLTGGTSYTYKAYDKANCNSADEIASRTFTTLGLTASSVTHNSATLTLSSYTSNWWLKQTAPSTGTCTAGEADYSHALSSLTPGAAHAYTAYSEAARRAKR